jgi:uncharacterized protein YbjT (DUF2867 family)/uncharacterized protein YndB with AHSA1/START domain
MSVEQPEIGTIALTGTTGYVGGRLVARLLHEGYRLKCLVREPKKLQHRSWVNDELVEIVQCDLDDFDVTTRALEGCCTAYYLVHSMSESGHRSASRNRRLASTFARSAESAGVDRIVYLGELLDPDTSLDANSSLRFEVEQALTSRSVPVTVFRTGIIIGSGSASFEILRYLVERQPIMTPPAWVNTESQPIAVRNVLGYLVQCLRVPETVGRVLEIGGADVVSFRDLMAVMAEELELPTRRVFALPMQASALNAWWIHLVTPVSAGIARQFAEGLRTRRLPKDAVARRLLPQEIFGVRDAISLALQRIHDNKVETTWYSAGRMPGDPNWSGGTLFVDTREVDVHAKPDAVYRALQTIGGKKGWYATAWLWRIRGLMDKVAGGPGLIRGRRDQNRVGYGEAVDLWRVTAVEEDRRLLLTAEMKLPGEAWLEFSLNPDDTLGSTRLTQTARFRPHGLAGLVYWYSVIPFHAFVFTGMINGIRRDAEQLEESESR